MNNQPPLTTLRVEVQGFRHAAMHALPERNDQFIAMVKAELARQLQPENLELILRDEADKAVKEAITSEIRKYLIYGEGRRTVEQLAKAQLEDYFKNRD